jgi:hypothetical protein
VNKYKLGNAGERLVEAIRAKLDITGFGQEADVQRCKEAGIDCDFLKPVDPAEIQKVLAKAECLRLRFP